MSALIPCLLILLGALPSAATTTTRSRTLAVGITEAPPFCIRNDDGSWGGIDVEMWQALSHTLGYAYQFHEDTLGHLIQGVEQGHYDAALGALTITADRERILDFSQPYFISGLGIAVPVDHETSWWGVISQFFSPAFLKVVGGLVLLLLIFGFLVWAFERRGNNNQFDHRPIRGVGSAIWWAAVTMTTVGYGDKAPTSFGGRVIGMIWMFTGVVVISGFTAGIASSLTVHRLNGPVHGVADLPKARVGAVTASTGAQTLNIRHIAFAAYDTEHQALEALSNGQLDAVVFDAPILRYEILQHHAGRLRVLPGLLEQQYYGIALPSNSPLRELINRHLLRLINSDSWQTLVAEYLGRK